MFSALPTEQLRQRSLHFYYTSCCLDKRLKTGLKSCWTNGDGGSLWCQLIDGCSEEGMTALYQQYIRMCRMNWICSRIHDGTVPAVHQDVQDELGFTATEDHRDDVFWMPCWECELGSAKIKFMADCSLSRRWLSTGSFRHFVKESAAQHGLYLLKCNLTVSVMFVCGVIWESLYT